MKAINDNVLVKVAERVGDRTTASGLYIPESVDDGKILFGTVFHVGEVPLQNGQYRKINVTEGDTVWFGAYKASKLTVDGVTYHIVPESAILAVKE